MKSRIYKFNLTLLVFLILILTLTYQKIWALDNTTLTYKAYATDPIQYEELSRKQKEKIEICFEENSQCHADLARLSVEPPASSKGIGFGILGGFVLGFILESQLHH